MHRQVLAPGVEHGNHSAFGQQPGKKKLVSGLPNRVEQQVTHCGAVGQEERIKFIRQRENRAPAEDHFEYLSA